MSSLHNKTKDCFTYRISLKNRKTLLVLINTSLNCSQEWKPPLHNPCGFSQQFAVKPSQLHVTRWCLWLHLMSLHWTVIIYMRVRLWLTVWQIRHESLGDPRLPDRTQPPQLQISWRAAHCSPPSASRHMVVFMCQCVLALPTWRPAVVMSPPSSVPVFQACSRTCNVPSHVSSSGSDTT